jgi:hypothetical protein
MRISGVRIGVSGSSPAIVNSVPFYGRALSSITSTNANVNDTPKCQLQHSLKALADYL